LEVARVLEIEEFATRAIEQPARDLQLERDSAQQVYNSL